MDNVSTHSNSETKMFARDSFQIQYLAPDSDLVVVNRFGQLELLVTDSAGTKYSPFSISGLSNRRPPKDSSKIIYALR